MSDPQAMKRLLQIVVVIMLSVIIVGGMYVIVQPQAAKQDQQYKALDDATRPY